MRRLAASVTAAVLGLILILTPKILFPGLVEQPGLSMEGLEEAPTVTPAPIATPRFKATGVESAGRHPSPPFMIELDTESSYGFEEISLAHGTYGVPLFVAKRGSSSSIIVLVSSLSDSVLQLSLEGVEGIPEGVEVKLDPGSFILQPYEQRRVELKLSVSVTASASPVNPNRPVPSAGFVYLTFGGDGYSLGAGFLLKIV
ncbi:MAG: hypothetical protein QW172_05535 [Candidatus Bathyarchaeia archaeon]